MKPANDILPPCPATPNCVSTLAREKSKKMDPLSYSGALEEAKEAIKNLVKSLKRTQLKKEEGNYQHFTFTTFPGNFTDDVVFYFDDQEKKIHYRSASRVGYWDFGTNRRRMKNLSRKWEKRNR